MTLGTKLRQIRQKKNLSQIKLSKLSNVPQTTISNIERDICSPTIDTLNDIVKVLNVRINDLMEREK